TDFRPDRPSTKIVSHGVYARTRNPIYVGFALITAGVAFLADSLWALAAVPIGLALIHAFVVVREERYLERKFGEEYLAYKRLVRRWL
ncbi:MAG: isoprenylcysteine carboxylmethyltransferase family protein, partial [Candidatus Thermoplasmatota archaeon]